MNWGVVGYRVQVAADGGMGRRWWLGVDRFPVPDPMARSGNGTEANEENKELYGPRYLGWLL